MAKIKPTIMPAAESLYLDVPDLGGHLGLALGVDRVVEARRTEYQELAVVTAGPLGRVLILDGCIQATEFDEAGYHEMLVHVPLLTHPDPRRVLVIGGGDGGTAREVLRHASVQQVDLCEIDEGVIQAARDHLPSLAGSLDDPRVSIHIADGAEFAAGQERAYDVILVDSSDPEGPASVLYTPEFYAALKAALTPGGLVCSQMESYFIYPELIRRVFGFLPDIFPAPRYYTTNVPTYNSGVIGFALCAAEGDPAAVAPDPVRAAALGQLRHYTPGLHSAAFVLPRPALGLLPPAVEAAQQSI